MSIHGKKFHALPKDSGHLSAFSMRFYPIFLFFAIAAAIRLDVFHIPLPCRMGTGGLLLTESGSASAWLHSCYLKQAVL